MVLQNAIFLRIRLINRPICFMLFLMSSFIFYGWPQYRKLLTGLLITKLAQLALAINVHKTESRRLFDGNFYRCLTVKKRFNAPVFFEVGFAILQN